MSSWLASRSEESDDSYCATNAAVPRRVPKYANRHHPRGATGQPAAKALRIIDPAGCQPSIWLTRGTGYESTTSRQLRSPTAKDPPVVTQQDDNLDVLEGIAGLNIVRI
jgi:hypothetical protein